jgi:hypothetical protein
LMADVGRKERQECWNSFRDVHVCKSAPRGKQKRVKQVFSGLRNPVFAKVACVPRNLLRLDRSSLLFSKCDQMWESCGLLTTAVKNRASIYQFSCTGNTPLRSGLSNPRPGSTFLNSLYIL